jgi:hypothetical protein
MNQRMQEAAEKPGERSKDEKQLALKKPSYTAST